MLSDWISGWIISKCDWCMQKTKQPVVLSQSLVNTDGHILTIRSRGQIWMSWRRWVIPAWQCSYHCSYPGLKLQLSLMTVACRHTDKGCLAIRNVSGWQVQMYIERVFRSSFRTMGKVDDIVWQIVKSYIICTDNTSFVVLCLYNCTFK